MGTDIQLALTSASAEYCESFDFLQMPLLPELGSRLTTLDLDIEIKYDYRVMWQLSALQHLRLSLRDGAELLIPDPADYAGKACHLTNLRSLWLRKVPYLQHVVTEQMAAALQQLRALRLDACSYQIRPDAELPASVFQLPALTRIDFAGFEDMAALPDLSRLPLRCLCIDDSPELDLRAGSRLIGGATGLTELRLGDSPTPSQESADAICALPSLRVLALDFWSYETGIFWAAALQRRLDGRCETLPVTEHSKTEWPYCKF